MFRNHLSTSNLSPRMPPLLRAIAWLALTSLGLLGACASPNSTSVLEDSVAPARVTFRDYRQGTSFVLVNDAHTDRVELYSKISAEPSTKVASNEVMTALLDFLESSGFEEQARPGVAPRSSTAWRWSGEIETSGRSVFFAVNDKTPTAEKKMFLDCYMNHVQLWSNIFQLQRVEGGRDEVFKKPELGR